MAVRGCGTRAEDGLYLCVECSPFRMPVEYFLIDPPVLWEGPKVLRSPMLVPSKRHPGVQNVLLGVGKEGYPFVPDFVEEGKVMGFSKRIPRDFPIEELTPFKSRMILMHPRAIPDFKYEYAVRDDVARYCPKRTKELKKHKEGELCVSHLWDLSVMWSYDGKHEVTLTDKDGNPCTGHLYILDQHGNTATDWSKANIKIPSTTYTVNTSLTPSPNNHGSYVYLDLPYKHGLFISLPIGRLDYVNRKREVPEDLAERVKKSKWKLEVCEE